MGPEKRKKNRGKTSFLEDSITRGVAFPAGFISQRDAGNAGRREGNLAQYFSVEYLVGGRVGRDFPVKELPSSGEQSGRMRLPGVRKTPSRGKCRAPGRVEIDLN
jgi:hypothetical protein